MRRLPLLALLALAACHRESATPPDAKNQAQPTARTTASPPPSPQQAAQDAAREDAAGARDVLHRYYGLIEAGHYRDAWAMRSGGRGIDADQFAAHFSAYEDYHSQVGPPSLPVRSDGWDYVEVPVMTTGRFIGGKPFGSTGSVTLRRLAPGNAAGEPGWRIYTG
jgi:hypothetical protein